MEQLLKIEFKAHIVVESLPFKIDNEIQVAARASTPAGRGAEKSKAPHSVTPQSIAMKVEFGQHSLGRDFHRHGYLPTIASSWGSACGMTTWLMSSSFLIALMPAAIAVRTSPTAPHSET